MSEDIKEIMITQQDLIDWIDRPPSNEDIDLINYIVNRLENFYKLQEENERLKDCYRINYFKYRNKVYDGRIVLKQRADYKSRINKVTNEINRIIEIIQEQPSKDKLDDL